MTLHPASRAAQESAYPEAMQLPSVTQLPHSWRGVVTRCGAAAGNSVAPHRSFCTPHAGVGIGLGGRVRGRGSALQRRLAGLPHVVAAGCSPLAVAVRRLLCTLVAATISKLSGNASVLRALTVPGLQTMRCRAIVTLLSGWPR